MFFALGASLIGTGAGGSIRNLGRSVSLSSDGNTLAAGAQADDTVSLMITL